MNNCCIAISAYYSTASDFAMITVAIRHFTIDWINLFATDNYQDIRQRQLMLLNCNVTL